MKFTLQWSDDHEPQDPRVVTENGQHSYSFETGSREDAETVAKSFMMIEPEHNFSNYQLIEEEQK